MRTVILFGPKAPVEHWKKGNDYAEMSIGVDFHGDPSDEKLLAKYLREMADMLEAPTLPDSELI